MSPPKNLLNVIAQARLAMSRDIRNELRPFHRRGLYSALEQATRGRGQEAQARLAVLSAQQVLPIWQRECPHNDLPLELLQLAKGILAGTVDAAAAAEAAGKAWEQLEHLGSSEAVSDRCVSAGEAAREALVAALGREAFDNALIGDQETDAELDPWSSDTASWAVAAWSGAAWDPQSDPAQRRAFWHWWLTEAVPQAWRATVEG